MFFLMVQILSHLHLPNSKWPLSGALPHRRPGHRAGTRHRSGALAPVRGRQTAAPGPRRPRDRRCPSPGWCPPRLRAGPNFWGSPGQRQLPRMAFGPKYLDKWTNITEKMVGKCCSWPHRFVEALTSHDHKDRRAGAGPVLVVHVISLQIRGIRSRKMTDLLLKPQGFRRHCERNSWQCPAGTQQKMQLKESHV